MDACPDSAKVRLNNGILERRKFNWNKAIEHFQKASDLDPTYCEPIYWMGLTVRPLHMSVCERGLRRTLGVWNQNVRLRFKWVQ
jgi:hypothetical protein